MNILDRIQGELRDPSYSDHVSRATEAGLREGQECETDRLYEERQVDRAFAWLETEEGKNALKDRVGECVLVSGERIVGFGATWQEAGQMASRKGIAPCATVRIYLESSPGTL